MTVRREMLGGAAARGVMVAGCPLARERNTNITAPTVSFDGAQAPGRGLVCGSPHLARVIGVYAEDRLSSLRGMLA